ncbi:uncharacterized protein LOC124938312 [Impatiens glandulifera]|uniref:uncharacterized protein LOC124938312 n=1 Tax=Impatiens glandulifera TaxID=253017 RepID=UPI001FB17626|nr:uncharacterized protein LOC124938312 [Impatiens glandulifera]
MDHMDIDEICEIPDTPDRFTAESRGVVFGIRKESNTSVAGHSGNQARGKGVLIVDIENGQTPSLSSRKNLCISSKNHHEINSGLANSPSTNDTYMFRRAANKTVNAFKGKAIADMTGDKGKGPLPLKPLIIGKSEDDLHTQAIISSVHDSYKGKGKLEDKYTGQTNTKNVKGLMSEARVIGQKRLVRNGCIAPLNIAKSTQMVGNHNSTSVNIHNNGSSSKNEDTTCRIDIKDLVAEDNTKHRGQGLLRTRPLLSKEPNSRTIYTSSRSSVVNSENTCGASNASGDVSEFSQMIDGWRSTRNRSKKVSDESQSHFIPLDDPYSNQRHENSWARKNYVGTDTDDFVELNPTGLLNNSTSFGSSRVPPHVSQPEQSNECYRTNITKRKKQASTSQPTGTEVVLLSPLEQQPSSRLSRNLTIRNQIASNSVIEIDESPQTRTGPQRGESNIHGELDARAQAIQVEADERLARELQEQLYNEGGTYNPVAEIDEDIALALQQETSHRLITSQHPQMDEEIALALQQETSPIQAHIFNRRGGARALNLNRQLQSRPSQNVSGRRGSQARNPASRLSRLRSRTNFPPSRVSHQARSSLFPPDMDVDMRMYILETMEAFGDMEMQGNFLQVQRDFNENDYEMLLALDENNHQHGGTSVDRINSLPHSTVLNDNFEEACAICLDTPTIGDTIRHLPCFHKFHKDCIDPWLQRKTSCPICKSSIT